MTQAKGVKRNSKRAPRSKKKKPVPERDLEWAEQQLQRCREGFDRALGALDSALERAAESDDSAALIRIAKFYQDQEASIQSLKAALAQAEAAESGGDSSGRPGARAARLVAAFGGQPGSGEGG